MKMCRKCRKVHKDNGWYVSNDDKVSTQAECQLHPRLDNWRVARTLKTLVVWGMDDGYQVTVDRGQKVVVNIGDGWIHERSAFLKLFDYEHPYVDLLVAEGLLERRECARSIESVQPKSVRVTMKGSTWLKEIQLRKEAEKKLDEKIAVERAFA